MKPINPNSMLPKLVLTALALLVFAIAIGIAHTEYKEGHYLKAVIVGTIAGCTFGMALMIFLL